MSTVCSHLDTIVFTELRVPNIDDMAFALG
jgi:hypothetical protein